MNFNRIACASVLAVVLTPTAFSASTQSAPPPSWQLSRAQVRSLEQAQPSVENYEKLEHYYRGRAANYRLQVQEMDAILAQREETAQHAGGKYEESVDSGRRLRAYYLQMALNMESHAQFWADKRQHLQ